MERMWRKVNQGLTSTTSTVFKQSRNNNNSNSSSNNNNNNNNNTDSGVNQLLPLRQSASVDDGPVYANVPQYNRGWGYIDTSKCRKRRRKIKPRRNSSKDKKSKTKNRDKSKNPTKETSLRERAVAKLKILNFNINWDVHMKPCGSRANSNILTRRLCRNRSCDDNELYRSNSFKFERFRRDDMNDVVVNTLPKQINVCDDYSLPIDFVKKRPSSLEHCRDVRFVDDFPSPGILNEQIFVPNPRTESIGQRDDRSIKEVRPTSRASTSAGPKLLRNYCEPKDSKKSTGRRTNPKEFSYNSDSSLPNSTDEEVVANDSKYDSSDTAADTFSNFNEPEYANQERSKPQTITPSPYYYADLLAASASNNNNSNTASAPKRNYLTNTAVSSASTSAARAKKFQSFLDDPPTPTPPPPQPVTKKRTSNLQKRHSITERDVTNRCDTFSSTTSDDSNCTECRKRRELRQQPLNSCDSLDDDHQPPSPAPPAIASSSNCCIQIRYDVGDDDSLSMPPLGPAACICAAPNNDEEFHSKSIFYVHHQIGDDVDECANCTLDPVDVAAAATANDMGSNKRRIQVYETAFDSTGAVAHCSNDNFDIEERIRNVMMMEHKTAFQTPTDAIGVAAIANGHSTNKHFNCDFHNKNENEKNLSQDLQNLHIGERGAGASDACAPSSSSKVLPQHRYTHSPPSTAPLPVKFSNQHGKKTAVSIRQLSKKCSHGVVLASERVMQLRHGKRRTACSRATKKISSTESMSSSSGSGSMESLHSSTSEGNRSTTSSESRQSASLSSHSSDSGARVRYPLRAPVIVHANMNILSPISDKSISIQEMVSTAADGAAATSMATAASARILATGDDVEAKLLAEPENQKMKRRYLQNRASLLLKDEILGSDSGISLQSRDEAKTKNLALHNFNNINNNNNQSSSQSHKQQQQQQQPSSYNNSGLSLHEEFANLPFDMPKLRSRNILMEQKQCTSGSATSVDLGDLPFDMPKLKRRLRAQPGHGSATMEAATTSLDLPDTMHDTSNQSLRADRSGASFRQNLSLQFNKTTSLKLDPATNSRGLHLNLFGQNSGVDIDASLPLDRQSWYHGALTRLEAESTLRPLFEGSFLVRNCESARNDYSLSLKSAKGFMHMRIQQNIDTGKFILGEFSQPFDSVPDIIKHFCLNRLPVRGAEHMCLIEPVVAQLL